MANVRVAETKFPGLLRMIKNTLTHTEYFKHEIKIHAHEATAGGYSYEEIILDREPLYIINKIVKYSVLDDKNVTGALEIAGSLNMPEWFRPIARLRAYRLLRSKKNPEKVKFRIQRLLLKLEKPKHQKKSRYGTELEIPRYELTQQLEKQYCICELFGIPLNRHSDDDDLESQLGEFSFPPFKNPVIIKEIIIDLFKLGLIPLSRKISGCPLPFHIHVDDDILGETHKSMYCPDHYHPSYEHRWPVDGFKTNFLADVLGLAYSSPKRIKSGGWFEKILHVRNGRTEIQIFDLRTARLVEECVEVSRGLIRILSVDNKETEEFISKAMKIFDNALKHNYMSYLYNSKYPGITTVEEATDDFTIWHGNEEILKDASRRKKARDAMRQLIREFVFKKKQKRSTIRKNPEKFEELFVSAVPISRGIQDKIRSGSVSKDGGAGDGANLDLDGFYLYFFDTAKVFNIAGNKSRFILVGSGSDKGIYNTGIIGSSKTRRNSNYRRSNIKDSEDSNKGNNLLFLLMSKSRIGKEFIFGNHRDTRFNLFILYLFQKRSGSLISSQMVDDNISVNEVFHNLNLRRYSSKKVSLPFLADFIFKSNSFREIFTQNSGTLSNDINDIRDVSFFKIKRRGYQPFNPFNSIFENLQLLHYLSIHLASPLITNKNLENNLSYLPALLYNLFIRKSQGELIDKRDKSISYDGGAVKQNKNKTINFYSFNLKKPSRSRIISLLLKSSGLANIPNSFSEEKIISLKYDGWIFILMIPAKSPGGNLNVFEKCLSWVSSIDFRSLATAATVSSELPFGTVIVLWPLWFNQGINLTGIFSSMTKSNLCLYGIEGDKLVSFDNLASIMDGSFYGIFGQLRIIIPEDILDGYSAFDKIQNKIYWNTSSFKDKVPSADFWITTNKIPYVHVLLPPIVFIKSIPFLFKDVNILSSSTADIDFHNKNLSELGLDGGTLTPLGQFIAGSTRFTNLFIAKSFLYAGYLAYRINLEYLKKSGKITGPPGIRHIAAFFHPLAHRANDGYLYYNIPEDKINEILINKFGY